MTLGHGTRKTQWLWNHRYARESSKILPIRAAGARGCTCFERGHTSQEALHNLLKTRNLSRLGRCLRKHLDATFDLVLVLQEDR